ncbi:hypothetical protein [Arsenicicoccus bolidensis]|uniref:Uncharacterized protein n=1 Tax=Arsenicicoccus bolidensis TaxID=229480 RepID=A0ABS9PYW4_9MICO|nr:hypothetical protein [Arsenicicoccus bolidensis]MCG7320815.1 hypothetical protein [Arsenicicoccus bolidensis]
MDAKEVASYIQLLLNLGAVVGGAAVWKTYVDQLKQSVSDRESQIGFWKDRVTDLEKRSPEALEASLIARIDRYKDEIGRLSRDREDDQERLENLTNEKKSLESTLQQAQGFRQMLEMEGGEEEELTEEDERLLFGDGERDVIKIGDVGVDSGQLMITDPCYVDSEWQEIEYQDIRRYRDLYSGEHYEFRKDFDRYDRPPSGKDGGPTVNELIEAGKWVQIPNENVDATYSYAGACAVTLDTGYGELKYNLGHAGAGVAFRTAFGDGLYPVYAERRGGRIVRVYVNVG